MSSKKLIEVDPIKHLAAKQRELASRQDEIRRDLEERIAKLTAPGGLEFLPGDVRAFLRGERGEKGERGEPGIQGERGVPGLEGKQGIQGPQGERGLEGRSISAGNKKPIDSKDGDLFIDAKTGDLFEWTGEEWKKLGSIKGPKGDKGEKGPRGDRGPNGMAGEKGADGAPGPQGIQGPQGFQGVQGPPGDDGVGLPPGGTTGQVPRKKSNDDFDIEWATVSGGGGAVDSVNGQTGVVVITKSDIGLGNVDNTSDANKPISTATQAALDAKIDLVSFSQYGGIY